MFIGKRISYTVLMMAGIFLFSCQSRKETGNIPQEPLLPLRESLVTELISLHEEGQINGFGVGIVNEEKILFTRGVGCSNVEAGNDYLGSTIQNIGSVSKTFIGIALMKAQEMGMLKLDDPVNDYLPFQVKNPYFPDVAITLRHLATHTSTILDTDFYDQKSYVLKEAPDKSDTLSINEQFNLPESQISMMEFLENSLSREGAWYQEKGFLQKKPGEQYVYTNVGATLAAAALERASGMTFNEFATTHILKPLGMNYSGWSFADVNMARHSTLYANRETPLPYYTLITYPDGGLLTTPVDLCTYLMELIRGYSGQGTLLSPESYAELFRPQLDDTHFQERDRENNFDDEYNSGIFMGFTPKGYVGHTGGDPGIATFMFFDPETKTGRLLMINTSIVNREGVDQFYAIWNTLMEYEPKLDSLSRLE